MAQTSSLYGDALIKSSELKNVAVFDEMGRDYQIKAIDKLKDDIAKYFFHIKDENFIFTLHE
jgi:hypothetical protein